MHAYIYIYSTFSKILCFPQFAVTYPTFLSGYTEVLNRLQHLEQKKLFLLFTPDLHHFMAHLSHTTLLTAFPPGNQPYAPLVYLWPRFNLS